MIYLLRVAQSYREIDTSYIERVFAQKPSYYPGDGGWMHGFHPSGSDELATLFRCVEGRPSFIMGVSTVPVGV
jgi:hypothetical protein